MLKLAQNVAFGYRIYPQGHDPKSKNPQTAIVDIGGGLGDWVAKPITDTKIIAAVEKVEKAKANYALANFKIEVAKANSLKADLETVINAAREESSATINLVTAMFTAGMKPANAIFVTKDAKNIENSEPFDQSPVWVVTEGSPSNRILVNPTEL